MDDQELVEYRAFRTGYTFEDIRQMLWSYSDNPNDWPNVSRHTVLGKWREIKLEMWEHHKRCKEEYESTQAQN
jgi:hypothetical protein